MIKLPQYKADFLRHFTTNAESPRLSLAHVNEYNGALYAATTNNQNLHAVKLDILLAHSGAYALAGQWLHKIDNEDMPIQWAKLRHLATDAKRYETEALTEVSHNDNDLIVFTSGHILPKKSVDRLIEYGVGYKVFAQNGNTSPILFKFDNGDFALIMPVDMVGYNRKKECAQEESEDNE